MSIESEQDMQRLARIGKIVGLTLREMKARLRPGMTTGELDHIGEQVLASYGARSAPQQLYGFPGVNCISLNEEAVHGIPPGTRVIRPGDLVKLDVTAELEGLSRSAPDSRDGARQVDSSLSAAGCVPGGSFTRRIADHFVGEPDEPTHGVCE